MWRWSHRRWMLAPSTRGQHRPSRRRPPCPCCSHGVWGCSHQTVAHLPGSIPKQLHYQTDSNAFPTRKNLGEIRRFWCLPRAIPDVKPSASQGAVLGHVGQSLVYLDSQVSRYLLYKTCCFVVKRSGFCGSWLILPGMWALDGTITAADSFILFAMSRKWKGCRRQHYIPNLLI